MTDKQRTYIDAMSRRLHLPPDIRDAYCQQQFSCGFSALDVRQASELIDRMQAWESLPADLQRMKGQMDLFTLQDTIDREVWI